MGPHPPRIYCINANTLMQHKAWHALLARVAAMHFNVILLTGSHVFALHAQANNASGLASLKDFSDACQQKNLHLYIDLELDRFAQDHPLVLQRPKHFFCDAKQTPDLPDPRFEPQTDHAQYARLRLDTEGTHLALQYWQPHLASLLSAGIRGFRCLEIPRIAPEIWRSLIEQTKAVQRNVEFFAWTPGCTAQQLHAIQSCQFDGVFSSDAWWDYRASWLVEEHQRLSAFNTVIAAPEDAQGTRLRCNLHSEEPSTIKAAYVRALLSAASIGDGLLLSSGFEYGADQTLEHYDISSAAQGNGHPLFDLSTVIASVNDNIRARQIAPSSLRLLSSPSADIALLLKESPKSSQSATLLIINADLNASHTISGRILRERTSGWSVGERIDLDQTSDQNSDHNLAAQLSQDAINCEAALTLPPSGMLQFQLSASQQISIDPPKRKSSTKSNPLFSHAARIAIENLSPHVNHGRFAVKRIVGSTVSIEADIFSDGHDMLAAVVKWRAADEKDWHELTMQAISNDRWRGMLPLERVGRHYFMIEAWRDNFANFRDELSKKVAAGIDVTLELQEGRQYIEKLIANPEVNREHVNALKQLLKQLPTKGKIKSAEGQAAAIAVLLCTETAQTMRTVDPREFKTQSVASSSINKDSGYIIDAERKAAEFSSWYELFPRSQSGDTARHGNFDDVIARLPAVSEMGFDTLYFPPIHPIGRKNMKGKNNSLTPGPDDPGSPYAIGSEAGGHDAIHPQLGTLQDFRRLVTAAQQHGLEIALDFAIQCSPDHPWLKQHPDWFAWRPDGSIRYAENPPKKYEDIVNVDFYADGEQGSAIPDLWFALRDVVLFWVQEGVRVFRVDNPHTKPLPFWEWLIADIRSQSPDTIFLSEAFTRPKPMYRLAKAGFSQSYTYFTWRHEKQEFIDYMTELSSEEPREFFRPHFFVNTPDINPHFLQRSGRAGFLIRSALAATLSGLWGVYSGFELCEAQAMPGKEEYLDSEKYEIRAWDWQRPGNIVHEISLLNRIRKNNPALHSHLDMQFHFSSSEHILYFSKSTPSPGQEQHQGQHQDNQKFGDNVLLIAINLDPFAAHSAEIELPLWKFGLPDHAALQVEELMSESRFIWSGKHQHIHLDPQQIPFAIWRVRPYGNDA